MLLHRRLVQGGILVASHLMLAIILLLYMDVLPLKPKAMTRSLDPRCAETTTVSSSNIGKNRSLPQSNVTSTTQLSHSYTTPMPPPHSNAIEIPDIGVLKNMSLVDLIRLYQSYIVAPQVTCNAVTRMGRLLDGGWELCEDPQYKPPKDDCLVYSYGIDNDFSFDDDMASYGCEVHSFDPTMETHGDFVRGMQVYFHMRGIGGSNRHMKIQKNNRIIRAKVDTIATHRRMYQHESERRRLDVVKIDVEGYEFEALMTSLDDGSLADTRQLNFETHLMLARQEPYRRDYIKYLILLKKVYDSGFRIYTTHRNYVHSRFFSSADRKYHAFCHEVHTVNILNRNTNT
ncbi:methyltransferase-like protein 24 [Elysia marginata]|uniref:Methyltransferase-like protein 24 n=1 Tax=Elysia marginata TaxID=1093978 RepID=A0AAV4GHZ7_9GAST|nr:methyltransferase-like protein 24 [Elysia marginata]